MRRVMVLLLLLSSAVYGLDNAGNRLRETYEDGTSARFGYDGVDRLWEGEPAVFGQAWSDDFERAELGTGYMVSGGQWALTTSLTDKWTSGRMRTH